MKRILYLFTFLFVLTTASFAQEEGERMQNLMREYIQKRLNLSKSEADRFAPVFLDYFNEQRKVNQQYKGDPLVQQQKIVDLRLRYREQFKNIMGEKRSNDVFNYERDFVDEVRKLKNEIHQNRNDNRVDKKIRGQ